MEWVDRVFEAIGTMPVEQPDTTGPGQPGSIVMDVAPYRWHQTALVARDRLGCAFFDWLSAVDLLDEGFEVTLRVAAPSVGRVDSLILRATVPRDTASVACICDVYRGAAWHERETYEMFGIDFVGHGELLPLLLPDGFEGHPLRKDFVLASRVVKPWPGAKEPGESDSDASPSRRRTRPPGVPDPADWGPRPPERRASYRASRKDRGQVEPRGPRTLPSSAADEGTGDV
jgi:NADH-quinone oxidoreductase subunit C